MESSLFSSLVSTGGLILIFGGFVVGILSVALGGGMFFSVPLMQWIFPGITFGSVVGNVKVGSFFRSVASSWTTRRQIEYWRDIEISVLAFIGTIIGAFLIAYLNQSWILPATVLAVVFAELAPRIASYITEHTFHIAAFVCGLYAGTFGAGIGIILVALVRLKHPADKDIALVKIQARFIEFLLVIVAVITHWWNNNLIVAIWLPWSIGSFLGGYVGGLLLTYLSTFSGTVQKAILRIAYVVTILTAAIHF